MSFILVPIDFSYTTSYRLSIADVQMGFRKGVGTRDQIFNLRVIMEKANEASVPLYMAFVDYKKAFDTVKHDKLWNVASMNQQYKSV